ncbi:hypothetical protein ACJX0J_009337, partial [Zea mays]
MKITSELGKASLCFKASCIIQPFFDIDWYIKDILMEKDIDVESSHIISKNNYFYIIQGFQSRTLLKKENNRVKIVFKSKNTTSKYTTRRVLFYHNFGIIQFARQLNALNVSPLFQNQAKI